MEGLTQYESRLKFYIFQLCQNYHDTEDILQDTYLRYLESGLTLEGVDLIKFLKRVARNRFIDLYRKSKIERYQLEYETQQLPEGIEKLPIHFQEVIVFRYFFGFSYKRISKVMDVKMNTLMTWNMKAIKKLKDESRR